MDILKMGVEIVYGVFSEPNNPLSGIIIMAFLILIVLPAFAVVGSMRAVKDPKTQLSLKNPQNANAIKIFFILLGLFVVWSVLVGVGLL